MTLGWIDPPKLPDVGGLQAVHLKLREAVLEARRRSRDGAREVSLAGGAGGGGKGGGIKHKQHRVFKVKLWLNGTD